MPNLFGRTSPFDEAVDKICDIGTENDDWQLIMNLCDTVNTTQNGCRNMVKAILKKIKNADHYQLEHAVTLLDACVNNCNRPFHLELCARDHLNELKQYLLKNRTSTRGTNALKESMVKWSKAFGEDPQLYLLSVTIVQLKGEGVIFPSDVGNAPPVNTPTPAQSNSARQEESEEEMIKKAIELSLKESQGKSASGSSSNTAASSSIYPTFTADKPLATDRELYKVKALYDFEAAEENEITFKTGDVISVTDNSDQNWWKGRTTGSSGLFPANFVTKHLDSPPTPEVLPSAKIEPVKVTEVNPQQIDLLLEMLRKADATVTNEEEDKFIAELEEQVAQQEPLITAEYNRLKDKHGKLESINDDMSRVVGLFHKLLKEAPAMAPAPAPQPIQYSYHPQSMVPPLHHQNPQMAPGGGVRHYAPPEGQYQNQYANSYHQQPTNGQGPPPPSQQQHPPQQQQQQHPQQQPPPPHTSYPSQTPPPSYQQQAGGQQPGPQNMESDPAHFQPMYPGQPGGMQRMPPPPMYSQQPPPTTYNTPQQPNIAHVSPMAQNGPNSIQ